MVTRLDRYIAATVARAVAVVWVVLLALFTFTAFVGELGDVGTGRYGLKEAALYVVLSMPRLTYQLFPPMALLGTLLGLGAMAGNNELVVMRASGISLARIIAAVAKIGAVLMVFIAVLGEWLAPVSEQYAQNLRNAALLDQATLTTGNSLWIRDAERFIHVRRVGRDGSFADIVIYSVTPDHRLEQFLTAASARYDGRQWRLFDVTINHLSERQVRVERHDEQVWVSPLVPQLVNAAAVEPQFLPVAGLVRYIGFLRRNQLSADEYIQALWKKMISPLATLVMVLLAVPFVFGSLRTVPISQRVFVGTLVGIGFYVINQMVAYMGLVFELSPVATAVAPTALFFALAVLLIRRIR